MFKNIFHPTTVVLSEMFVTAPRLRINAYFQRRYGLFFTYGKEKKLLGLCAHYITRSCDYSSCILCR
jgi:hypothetical protein